MNPVVTRTQPPVETRRETRGETGAPDPIARAERPRSKHRESGRRGSRARSRARLPLLLALIAVASCGEPDRELPRSLIELERMTFVPAGQVVLEGFSGPQREYGVGEELLVDRFEFTRGDWAVWGAGPGPWERLNRAPWGPGEEALPAYLTRSQAEAIAQRRGVRLLSSREWLFAAIGRFALPYPWSGGRGPAPKAWANTLGLGLVRPLAVGTFENGKSSYGCYDMLGNVWEWVADSLPEEGLAYTPGSVLGGSYLTHERPIYAASTSSEVGRPVFFSQALEPEHLAEDVGVRFCAEARPYLASRAYEWSDPAFAVRLRAIGGHWGANALPLLAAWVQEANVPEAVRHLHEGVLRGLD